MRSDSPNTFEPDVDTLKELATAHAGAAAEAAAERPDLLDALAERTNDMLCAGCEHQADYLNGITKDAERIKRERATRRRKPSDHSGRADPSPARHRTSRAHPLGAISL